MPAYSVGTLSEEGLLVYLHVLQTFLSQLPASPAITSSYDTSSDSEDESEEADQPTTPVSSTCSQGYPQALFLFSSVFG